MGGQMDPVAGGNAGGSAGGDMGGGALGGTNPIPVRPEPGLDGQISGPVQSAPAVPLTPGALFVEDLEIPPAPVGGFQLKNIELEATVLAHHQGVYLLGTQSGVLRSTDAQQWQAIGFNTNRRRRLLLDVNVRDIKRFGNVWVAAGDQGLLMGSEDGIDWKPIGATVSEREEFGWRAAVPRGDQLVILGWDDKEIVVKGGDLKGPWNFETRLALNDDDARLVLHTDNHILVVSDDANWVSGDGGRSFVKKTRPSNTTYLGASTARLFVFQQEDGRLVWSEDGTTWRVAVLPNFTDLPVDSLDTDATLVPGRQRQVYVTKNGFLTGLSAEPVSEAVSPWDFQVVSKLPAGFGPGRIAVFEDGTERSVLQGDEFYLQDGAGWTRLKSDQDDTGRRRYGGGLRRAAYVPEVNRLMAPDGAVNRVSDTLPSTRWSSLNGLPPRNVAVGGGGRRCLWGFGAWAGSCLKVGGRSSSVRFDTGFKNI